MDNYIKKCLILLVSVLQEIWNNSVKILLLAENLIKGNL